MEFFCSGRSGQLSDGARMREWRERGAAREAGGREASPQGSKNLLHQPRVLNASVRFCVSSVSRAARTQRHMASQPTPPPTLPPHLATQRKTKQVLSPEQPNVNPLLRNPALHRKAPRTAEQTERVHKVELCRLILPYRGPM